MEHLLSQLQRKFTLPDRDMNLLHLTLVTLVSFISVSHCEDNQQQDDHDLSTRGHKLMPAVVASAKSLAEPAAPLPSLPLPKLMHPPVQSEPVLSMRPKKLSQFKGNIKPIKPMKPIFKSFASRALPLDRFLDLLPEVDSSEKRSLILPKLQKDLFEKLKPELFLKFLQQLFVKPLDLKISSKTSKEAFAPLLQLFKLINKINVSVNPQSPASLLAAVPVLRRSADIEA